MKMIKVWINNRRARKLMLLRRKRDALQILADAMTPGPEVARMRQRIINVCADMLELEHKLKIHYRTNDIASF